MVYDLVIVGTGPAGLTAGVYAGRYMLNTVIIGSQPGGTIAEAHKVCNFPTYKDITGIELSQKLTEQAQENAEISYGTVKSIRKGTTGFELVTDSKTYKAKKVILAHGRKKRKLNAKGENEFLGKGVSYCATCDGAFFKDKAVAVVGGSDAALTAALLLAEYAKKVYIVYRKNRFFRAEPLWVRKVEENSIIEPVFNSQVTEIKGSDFVEKVILDSGELNVDGIFIEIGYDPDETLTEQLGLEMEKGYIVTDKNQRTSVHGVFAAGDGTNNPLKQAVTAAAEGAIAASSAYQELMEEN
ncbi:MAG: FAD-dependent oxidoreductase [Candidatus Woesearchaeota archaeon]